jgi:NADH dehydrogenase
MKVAITGGRGFVGRHLARALQECDIEVVSVVRPRAMGPAYQEAPGDDEFPIGLASATELAKAFAGCQAVAHCAGINRERGDQTFEAVHVEGTRNVLAACRQARVRKILLTSFLRARANCGSPYHESKWEAEQLVRTSGLDYTIFKAGVLYGPGDQLTTRLGEVLQRLPLFAGIGFGDPPVRPVAIEDMVALMLDSLEDPRLSKVTVPVVGPELLGLNEMVKRIGRSRGVQTAIIPLPVPIHRLLAALFELVSDAPLVTVAQVQMLAEGLAEATPPFDDLAPDLRPSTPFLTSSQHEASPGG